jgi:uncharacterized repeat protein (TIGR03847 family)
MSDSYELTEVDVFTATAVGIPGARTFYLQVVGKATQVSFKCEKQHVEALANALSSLLPDAPSASHPASGPTSGLASGPSSGAGPAMQLPNPTHAAWVVGSIALGMDESEGRVLVVLEEATEDDEGASARFGMTIDQARAFVEHGAHLVASGRPACVLCGMPIDVVGYACTCFN